MPKASTCKSSHLANTVASWTWESQLKHNNCVIHTAGFHSTCQMCPGSLQRIHRALYGVTSWTLRILMRLSLHTTYRELLIQQSHQHCRYNMYAQGCVCLAEISSWLDFWQTIYIAVLKTLQEAMIRLQICEYCLCNHWMHPLVEVASVMLESNLLQLGGRKRAHQKIWVTATHTVACSQSKDSLAIPLGMGIKWNLLMLCGCSCWILTSRWAYMIQSTQSPIL